MKKLLTALLLLAFAGAAAAADLRLPAKAARVQLTCPSGTGFYAGVNSYAQVANGTTTATLAPGTTIDVNSPETGAAIGLTAGYAWGDCVSGRFFAVEGMFDYQNLTGTNGVSVTTGGVVTPVTTAINSKYEFTQKFKIGANLSDIMTFLPNFGTIFPGMPTVAPGTSNPKAYIAGVVRESDVSATFSMGAFTTPGSRVWAVEPGLGAGIQSATANGSVVDVFIDYTFKGGGFTVGAVQGIPGSSSTANLGGVARAGIGVYW